MTTNLPGWQRVVDVADAVGDGPADDLRHAVHREPHRRAERLFGSGLDLLVSQELLLLLPRKSALPPHRYRQ